MGVSMLGPKQRNSNFGKLGPVLDKVLNELAPFANIREKHSHNFVILSQFKKVLRANIASHHHGGNDIIRNDGPAQVGSVLIILVACSNDGF